MSLASSVRLSSFCLALISLTQLGGWAQAQEVPEHKAEPWSQVHQYLAGEAWLLLSEDPTTPQAMKNEISRYIGSRYGGATSAWCYYKEAGDRYHVTFGGKENHATNTQCSDASTTDKATPYADYTANLYQDDRDNNDNTCGKSGNDIIEGSAEEDQYDPVADDYYNWWFEAGVFYHHFWEPDIARGSGDTDFNAGYSDGQSAVRRAEEYWNRAITHYRAGDSDSKDVAYWYIGRIAHLLADMSVPAHVHDDGHPSSDPEEYEEYMKGKDADWDGTSTTGEISPPRLGFDNNYSRWSSTRCDRIPWNPALHPIDPRHLTGPDSNCASTTCCTGEAKTLNEWYGSCRQHSGSDDTWYDWNFNHRAANPTQARDEFFRQSLVFRLFYSLAELTDDYPSSGVDGDDPALNAARAGGITDEEAAGFAPVLMAAAMQHIAGLYRLFWDQTHCSDADTDHDGTSQCAGDCNDGAPHCSLSCADVDDDSWCDADCNDADPSVHPNATEACDRKDNDCDGTVDEGAGTGVETCNNHDDDCDGSVDEGLGSIAETCNGVDDDCDGGVDEIFDCVCGTQRPCGTSGGQCAPGVQSCTAGAWGPCSGGTGPTDDGCPHDGLDNDCDGLRDEAICFSDPYCHDVQNLETVSSFTVPDREAIDILRIKVPLNTSGADRWHIADINGDGLNDWYVVISEQTRVQMWVYCKSTSMLGYIVGRIEDVSGLQPVGCARDGSPDPDVKCGGSDQHPSYCNTTQEFAVIGTTVYTAPSLIKHPDVRCTATSPTDPDDPWSVTKGTILRANGYRYDLYAVICGTDTDCSADEYCDRASGNPLEYTCRLRCGDGRCDPGEICSLDGTGPESCDGADNDCDGVIDETLPVNAWHRDADGDGYGNPLSWQSNCQPSPPPGYTADATDCDDEASAVHPGAVEIACDGRDEDCMPSDEAPDSDDDGFDVCAAADPGDRDDRPQDCDDNDPLRHPFQDEGCDGSDSDCSGGPASGEIDFDGDGYVACSPWAGSPVEFPGILGGGDCDDESVSCVFTCDDRDADGVRWCLGDCNDASLDISPNGVERCDGLDSDCNGEVDDASACLRACWLPHLTDTEQTLGRPAYYSYLHPAIASSGSNYAVVWEDTPGLWLVRLDTGGTQLGRTKVTSSAAYNPQVVWNGSEYAVGWTENNVITLQRLSVDGTVLGTAVQPIPSSSAYLSSFAWNGAEYGFLFLDWSSESWRLRFARVSRDGNLLAPSASISDAAIYPWAGRIVASGRDWGIVWTDSRTGVDQVYFTRFSPTGAKVGNDTQVSSSALGSSNPALAWSGSGYGVVYGAQTGSMSAVTTRVLDALGYVQSEESRLQGVSAGSWLYDIEWAGAEYGVIWDDYRHGAGEIYFARASADGARIGTEVRLTNNPATSNRAVLAWGGAEFGVAWFDERTYPVAALFRTVGCTCGDRDGDAVADCAPDNCPDQANGDQQDSDRDGAGDVCDCAPTDPTIGPTVAENCSDGIDNNCNRRIDIADDQCRPLDPRGLGFAPNSKESITWSPLPDSQSYGVYRGYIPARGMRAYDHQCLMSEVPDSEAQDVDRPEPGTAFYYLVTGLARDPSTGDLSGGPLGVSSSGVPRSEGWSATACGARVFVDPDVVQRWGHAEPYTPTGLSWREAYRSISEAVPHPQTRQRTLEIWARGTIADGGVSTMSSYDRGLRILGGFAGAETRAWERQPQQWPTIWDGNGGTTVLHVESGEAHVVVDGLTLRNASFGITVSAHGSETRVRNVSFEALGVAGVNAYRSFGPAMPRLVVEGSRFDAQARYAIFVHPNEAYYDIRIADNDFAGAVEDVMRLEISFAGSGGAAISGEIVRNRFRGGNHAITIRANDDNCETAVNAVIDPIIAANEISGTNGDAISATAEVWVCYQAWGTRQAVASPTIVANTISRVAGNGVSCRALRSGWDTATPEQYQARCEAKLWDNLITFVTGYAVAEGPDNVQTGLIADPVLVGNDLWGSATLYLDEGVTTLSSIEAVNALPGARDNFLLNPLYRNEPAGDLRLLAGSPAIDRGHPESPANPALDRRKIGRGIDGNQDGRGAPDVGANEAE